MLKIGDIVQIAGQGGGTYAIVKEVHPKGYVFWDVEWKTYVEMKTDSTLYTHVPKITSAYIADYIKPLIEEAAHRFEIEPCVEYGA
jgi:hypothetical protein